MFSWNPVEGAGEYILIVRVNITPLAPIRTTESSTYLNLNLKSTDVGAKVSWSVSAASGTVVSSPSIAQFTFAAEGTPIPTPIPIATATPLPPPQLINPTNGESVEWSSNQLVPFDWTDVSGAAAYRLSIYRNNEIFKSRTIAESDYTEQFQQMVFAVLQWDVRTIDSFGNIGNPSYRNAFSIGQDILPTPTPMPIDPDIDGNGILNILDVYQFSSRFATNDPKTDLDYNGLNSHSDLLMFIELFAKGKQ